MTRELTYPGLWLPFAYPIYDKIKISVLTHRLIMNV